MSRATVEQTLYNLVAPVVAPSPVIFDSQNVPAPAYPYYVIYILNEQSVGGTSMELPTTNAGVVNYSNDLELLVQFKGFGNGSLVKAQAIRDAFCKYSSRVIAQTGGLVFVDFGNIIDTTALQDSQFLEAFSVDVRFRTLTDPIAETLGTIGSVEAVGTIKNAVDPLKHIHIDVP